MIMHFLLSVRRALCTGVVVSSWMTFTATAKAYVLPPESPNQRDFTAEADGQTTWNPNASEPARVRINLRMTPWKITTGTDTAGAQRAIHLAQQPLTHTLRARLDKTNHFYFGEWHIQTTPIRWTRTSRRWAVRLDVARRYGSWGQLEENLGSMEVAGVLQEQGDRLFLLNGIAKKRFNDRMGQPALEIVAGHKPDVAARDERVSRNLSPSETKTK